MPDENEHDQLVRLQARHDMAASLIATWEAQARELPETDDAHTLTLCAEQMKNALGIEA